MPKYKKTVPTNTISRDMVSLSKDTENIYETVMIIAKRANQIAQETKQELEAKPQEFAVYTDDQHRKDRQAHLQDSSLVEEDQPE